MKTMKAMVVLVAVLAAAFSGMADDEVLTMFQISVSKGYLNLSQGVDIKSDLNGNAYEQKVTTFNATTSALPVAANITTAGMFFARNLSSNAAVRITATFELLPGEPMMGRLADTNILCVATTNYVPGLATNATFGTTVDLQTLMLSR